MNDIDILEEFLEDYIHDGLAIQYRVMEAIENLIQRNKDLEQIEKKHKEENGRLRDRINKTINKLNEDISDDNCMWVDYQEKIVKTAKTIIDRSNYAKEILELLEESDK